MSYKYTILAINITIMNKIITLDLQDIENSLEALLSDLILPINYISQVRKLVLSKDELNISLAFEIINTIYPEIIFQTLNYTSFNWTKQQIIIKKIYQKQLI